MGVWGEALSESLTCLGHHDELVSELVIREKSNVSPPSSLLTGHPHEWDSP